VKTSMTLPTAPAGGFNPGGALPVAVTAEVEAAVRVFAALPLTTMGENLRLGVDVSAKSSVTKAKNVMAPIAMIPPPGLPPATPPNPPPPPAEEEEAEQEEEAEEGGDGNLESDVGSNQEATSTGSSSNAGALIGGIIGGIAGVAGLIALVYVLSVFHAKRMKRLDIEKDDKPSVAEIARSATRSKLTNDLQQIDPTLKPDPEAGITAQVPVSIAAPTRARTMASMPSFTAAAAAAAAAGGGFTKMISGPSSSAAQEAPAQPEVTQLDKLLTGMNESVVTKIKEEITAAGLDPATVMEECSDAMDIIVKPIIFTALADYPALRELVDKRIAALEV